MTLDITEPVNASWLGGLFDGEGCFGLHAASGTGYNPSVQISMTHEKTVRRVRYLLREAGVVFTSGSIRDDHPKHKRAFYVRVGRMAAVERICALLVPFLVTKERAATLLLRYVRSRLKRGGVGADGRMQRGGRWSTEGRGISARERTIVNQLRDENRRGRR